MFVTLMSLVLGGPANTIHTTYETRSAQQQIAEHISAWHLFSWKVARAWCFIATREEGSRLTVGLQNADNTKTLSGNVVSM